MTSNPFLQACSRNLLDFSPARLDAWETPPYVGDPHYELVAQAIRTGRTFPVASKWGMFENKLNQTVVELWNIALVEPDRDLADLVSSYLGSLAGRFAVSLGVRR